MKRMIMFELTLDGKVIVRQEFIYINTSDEKIENDYNEWCKNKLLNIKGSFYDSVYEK